MDEDLVCDNMILIFSDLDEEFDKMVEKVKNLPPENMNECINGVDIETDAVCSNNGDNLYLRVKCRGRIEEVLVPPKHWGINPINQIPIDKQREIVLFLLEKTKQSPDGWTGTFNGFIEVYARLEYNQLLVQCGGNEFGLRIMPGIILQ